MHICIKRTNHFYIRDVDVSFVSFKKIIVNTFFYIKQLPALLITSPPFPSRQFYPSFRRFLQSVSLPLFHSRVPSLANDAESKLLKPRSQAYLQVQPLSLSLKRFRGSRKSVLENVPIAHIFYTLSLLSAD